MKYGKYEIKIKYNGDWPCLCGGRLIVIIDGKEWDFGNYVLVSGGSIHFDNNWNEEIEHGEWSIYDSRFPNGFF